MDESIVIMPREDVGATPATWRPETHVGLGGISVRCPSCTTATPVPAGAISPTGRLTVACQARRCGHVAEVQLVGWPVEQPKPKPARAAVAPDAVPVLPPIPKALPEREA